jgi:hypothetical protein
MVDFLRKLPKGCRSLALRAIGQHGLSGYGSLGNNLFVIKDRVKNLFSQTPHAVHSTLPARGLNFVYRAWPARPADSILGVYTEKLGIGKWYLAVLSKAQLISHSQPLTNLAPLRYNPAVVSKCEYEKLS